MVRIFKIFSVAALLLSVVLSANGEVALGNRVYLHLEYSRGGDRRFLSGLVKKLHKIAGKSKVKRPYKKITFHTKAKKWDIAENKQQFTVYIPGTSREWLRSFEMRRAIYGIIFYLRFGLNRSIEAGKTRLPVWMSTAVDEEILEHRSAEKFIIGDRDYSILQNIFKNSKNLPDFGALCRFENIPEDPAMAAVYRQMSCLLLELAAGKKLLPYMIEYSAAKRPDDHWLNRFPSPEEARIQLTDAAKKILWDRRSPMPEPLLKGDLDKLQTIVVPDLDTAGIPNGKMLNLSFADANKLFLPGKRPDINEVREYYSREWMLFSLRRSAKVKVLALKLSELALKLGADESWADEFEVIFRQLKEQLEFEETQYRTFVRLIFENLAVEQLYLWQFAAQEASYRAAGVGEGGRFLEKTEKEYFKKY